MGNNVSKVGGYAVYAPTKGEHVGKVGAYTIYAPAKGSHIGKIGGYAVYSPIPNSLGFINLPSIFEHTVGWTTSSGTFQSVSSGDSVAPVFGSVVFEGESSGTTDCILTQTVTIPANLSAVVAAGSIFEVGYYQNAKTLGSPSPMQAKLEALDASDNTLATEFSIDTPDGTTGTWAHSYVRLVVPTDAVKLRITFTLTAGGYDPGATYFQIETAELVDIASLANTSLNNGGFETGDLTGWSVTNGSPAADASYAASGTYSALLAPRDHAGSYDVPGGIEQFIVLTSGEKALLSGGTGKISINAYARGNVALDDSINISLTAYDSNGYAVGYVSTGFVAYDGTGSSISLETAALPTNTSSYRVALIGKDSGTSAIQLWVDDVSTNVSDGSSASVRAMSSSIATVLTYNPIRTYADVASVVLAESKPVRTFSSVTSAVIRQSSVRTTVNATSVVLRSYAVRTQSSSLYAVLKPRPPAAITYAGIMGAVIVPKPPARSYSLASCAVLSPPPPFLKARSATTAAVISPIPPSRMYSEAVGAVLQPKPPVYVHVVSSAVVIEAPPVALLAKTASGAVVLAPEPTHVTSISAAAIIAPLSGVPIKNKVQTVSAILKSVSTVSTGRRVVLITE